MTDRPDVDLLAAHVAGDADAFGILFRRHRDRLWAVALRTTGNPEDAADALQDALLSAHRHASSFRGDAAVTTWLHRIVVNASLDRLRRNKVRSVSESVGLPEESGEVASSAPGPMDVALEVSTRERVLRALELLPPDQKAALVLIDMEGFSVAEASDVLQAPEGTIKSRCARGRAKLAVLLADLLDDGTNPAPAASDQGPAQPATEGGVP